MALTGHLSDLSLSELIEFFCNQRKTGQLKVLYPEGPGYFYLQTGSVVDARIGVLRGIDAVYYALTLPNANFEFGAARDSSERTINQPWTQVVLEGLRRLDEGVIPSAAFPPDYKDEFDSPNAQAGATEAEGAGVPGFLSAVGTESGGKSKVVMVSAVAFAVLASVAAIGVPAGWYSHAKTPVVVSQPASTAVATEPESAVVPVESAQPEVSTDDAGLAARQKREKDKERAKAREEKAGALTAPGNVPNGATNAVNEAAKPGAKKVTVTVSYDESGRVTQASGGDASAIRIARQKRFPAGKAGSATVTIPIN